MNTKPDGSVEAAGPKRGALLDTITRPTFFFATIALLYAIGYLAHPALPGNNLQYPQGWWGWFDQGKYLLSAEAFYHFDFSAEKHFYPPLYPLIGAPFLHLLKSHPFWLVNLASLLTFAAVFVRVACRYVSRRVAVLLFFLAVIVNLKILEDFVIPWTTTLSAALISIALYGFLRICEAEEKTGSAASQRIVLTGFWMALAGGLVAALRPVDGTIGGILWLGYLGKAWQLSRSGKLARGEVMRTFACGVAGMSVGPLLFFGFNWIASGSPIGTYIQVNSANGFFPADIAEKFVSIFLNGYTLYLEPQSGIIRHDPWIALSLVGMVFILARGDWLLRVLVVAICVQFALYLPYGDLLPTGVWRFHNIHYFKWTYPYLALFAWLLLAYLRQDWRAGPRARRIAFGSAIGLLVLLCTLQLRIDKVETRVTASMAAAPADAPPSRQFRFSVSSGTTDLIDITGLAGGFGEVYFGAHRLWADGRELRVVRDFRVLPAPWGIRVLFIRPLHADAVVFQPDSRLNFAPASLKADVGSYRFALGKPTWKE